MESSPVSLPAYWRLLRTNRNYRLLWLAQIVSEIGDWLYAVSIYSLLLELTGKAGSVAAAFILQILPQFFVGPMAGVINDRISRKKVMIFADLMRAVIVFCMLLVRSREYVWAIYALLFLETVMWAFFEPGHNAVIPNITSGESEMVAANGLSSMTWSLNLALGAGLGGLVAVAFGRPTVFAINACSFLLSAALIRRMNFAEPHAEGQAPLSVKDLVDYSAFFEGLRYVSRNSRLLATLLLKAGMGLAGTHWVLLPIFGERIFPVHGFGLDPRRAGMLGMSLLMCSRGAGALIGPLIGGHLAGSSQPRVRRGIVLAFLAICAGYFLLGSAPNLWAASLAVVLAHAGGATVWVFSSSLIQIQTDDKFRGRVFSADFGCMVLTMSVVTYIAGAAVDAGIPARSIAICTGVAALLPAALWAWAQRFWGPANVTMENSGS